jgi:hypothetical protein
MAGMTGLNLRIRTTDSGQPRKPGFSVARNRRPKGEREASGTAYGLHFAIRTRGLNAPVGPLHGLYWFNRPEPIPLSLYAEDASAPGAMEWRLLIAVPDEATSDEVYAAIERMMAKRGTGSAPVPKVMTWHEGRAAQLLHVGRYDAEYPTIERLTTAIREAGLRPIGCHHEIYLSGPQTPPERTRTVIRQPVADGSRA